MLMPETNMEHARQLANKAFAAGYLPIRCCAREEHQRQLRQSPVLSAPRFFAARAHPSGRRFHVSFPSIRAAMPFPTADPLRSQ